DDRWIVRCPCGGAQIAARHDRRFYCVDCGNAWNQGPWAAVAWPDDATVAEMETILDERPDRRTRSWTPGQTCQDLRDENAARLPQTSMSVIASPSSDSTAAAS